MHKEQGLTEQALAGGALDLREVSSRMLYKPQKNGSALPQIERMGPSDRHGQRPEVYDGLHRKREGGKAHTHRRAPSQTSPSTPKPNSSV